METITITRQDGKEIELNIDKRIDWEVSKAREVYLLFVTDAQTDEEHIVGIFCDQDTAYDAGEYLEQTYIVSGDVDGVILSASDYLKIEGRHESPKQIRELEGLTALQYLNEEFSGE